MSTNATEVSGDKIVREMAKHLGLTLANLAAFNKLLKKKRSGLEEGEEKEYVQLLWQVFQKLSCIFPTKRNAMDQQFITDMNKKQRGDPLPEYPLQELRSLLTELFEELA